MKKYSASRTIIQHAVIEAESVEEARGKAAIDAKFRRLGLSGEVDWIDTSNRFMVFENLGEDKENETN
jgi:hypothetical protein